MKKFLVPALLLGLVGVAAAIASGSAPATSSGSGECHKASTGISCPMSSGECEETMGAKHCPDAAAERCAESAEKADCMEECLDKPSGDCSEKKKMECCPKSSEPVEKP